MKSLRNLLSADALRRTFSRVSLRFPLPFIFATALTLWGVFIAFQPYDFMNRRAALICWPLTEGFLLTLAVNLWFEFSGRRKYLKPAVMTAAGLALADLVLILVRNGFWSDYETVGRCAVTTALVAAIFFLPALRRYSRRELWIYSVEQSFNLAVAGCISAVMAIACLIIYLTLGMLFRLNEDGLLVSAIWVLSCWVPAVVFLSKIPRSRDIKGTVLPGKSAVGSFCKNVLLPLVLVYTLILYVYAAKIVVLWELPNASITWMVTGLMVTVLVMLYGLQRYSFGGEFSEAAVRISALAARWLPILLLPLLVLMSVGLIYRIGEYGITASRLYVAAFNIWAYATVIYLIVRRSANLNVAAASFAAVFVAVSVIPGLNFSAIANRVIRADVFTALRAAGAEHFPLTFDETRRLLSEMPEKEGRTLASKIAYLDDWGNHSQVSDIVVSSDRIYEWNILPYEYSESFCNVYSLEYTGAAPVPTGYGKVSYHTQYSFGISKAGNVTTVALEGCKVQMNADSLLQLPESREPLVVPAAGDSGDSAVVVFTELRIDDSDDAININHAKYYIFTK